jgi:hypothetical protein
MMNSVQRKLNSFGTFVPFQDIYFCECIVNHLRQSATTLEKSKWFFKVKEITHFIAISL